MRISTYFKNPTFKDVEIVEEVSKGYWNYLRALRIEEGLFSCELEKKLPIIHKIFHFIFCFFLHVFTLNNIHASKLLTQMKEDVLSGRIVRWVDVTALPIITKKTQLFYGSQQLQNGTFAETAANEVLEKVFLHKNRPSSISFTKSKLTNFLTGGTCSAMAMGFLKKYLAIKKGPYPTNQPKSLLNRVRKLKKDFETSSPAFRAVQAALNTIEVVNAYTDHAKDKAQALLNYIDCSISPAFDEIDLDQSSKTFVEQTISSLPLGMYFARVIRAAENAKLEAYGHSTIFIKEKSFCLFYDPGKGAIAFPQSQSGRIMKKEFDRMNEDWWVSKLRFYQISPQKSSRSNSGSLKAFSSISA